MNTFSLSKLEKKFNEIVQVGVMCWGKKMMLHVMDVATGYSELEVIDSRNMDVMLATLDKMCYMRHGPPKEVRGDRRFDKSTLRRWMRSRGSKFVLYCLRERAHSFRSHAEKKGTHDQGCA